MLALDTESQPQQLQELTLYLQGFWLQEIRWFKPQQEQAERSDSAAGAAHALHCPPAKVPQPQSQRSCLYLCSILFTPIFPNEVEKLCELHLQAEKNASLSLPASPTLQNLVQLPKWSSTCTHSVLLGTVQEADVPRSSGHILDAPNTLPSPGRPTPCTAACKQPRFFKQICSLCSILWVKL